MSMFGSRRTLPALALAGLAALGAVGCKDLTCGQGTKQVQASDGSLMCIPAEQPAQSIPCDVDGGNAVVEAGKCVSKVVCDPGTTMAVDQNGKTYCIGTAGASGCSCPAQPAGKICVTGNILDWKTGKPFQTPPNVRIAAYEPLAFLGNPSSMPLAEDTNAKGCYTFSGIAAPSSGLVAIAVGDPANAATPTYELSGSGATVVAGKSYKVDVFAVTRADVTKWSAVAGRDVDATGAYVACYYDDAVPDPANLSFSETKPLAGIKITDVGGAGVVTAAKYFDPDRATLSSTLAATGPVGCGEAPPPSGISTFSGAGGMCTQMGGGAAACKWETHPGGSTAHVIFVDRFHNCALSPTASTCQ